MKKKFKQCVLFIWNSAWEMFTLYRMKLSEIKKFKDKRRVEIFSKVVLTTEQKKAIDSLYEKNYGGRIPYIWHQYYTAYTGNFDANYFPELLYIPEFEFFMNLNKKYNATLSDKNILQYFASVAKVKMPKMKFSCVDGMIKDSEYNLLTREDFLNKVSNIGECFFKPTIDTCSGEGCAVMRIKDGIDLKSGLSTEDIFKASNRDWVIQERLCCHESIRNIYSHSVNTFRIITYRWKSSIHHMPVIMRIGRGGANVDNAHAGGMFIAVSDDGVLHKAAFTEFKEVFSEHPDTLVTFDGYKIDHFGEVIESAKRCHALFPQIGCVNWDFTIDEQGKPVLIEANIMGGSIWLIEMAHGRGAFGESTAEVLRWLKKMKHVKRSERKKYMFGNLDDGKNIS